MVFLSFVFYFYMWFNIEIFHLWSAKLKALCTFKADKKFAIQAKKNKNFKTAVIEHAFR